MYDTSQFMLLVVWQVASMSWLGVVCGFSLGANVDFFCSPRVCSPEAAREDANSVFSQDQRDGLSAWLARLAGCDATKLCIDCIVCCFVVSQRRLFSPVPPLPPLFGCPLLLLFLPFPHLSSPPWCWVHGGFFRRTQFSPPSRTCDDGERRPTFTGHFYHRRGHHYGTTTINDENQHQPTSVTLPWVHFLSTHPPTQIGLLALALIPMSEYYYCIPTSSLQ